MNENEEVNFEIVDTNDFNNCFENDLKNVHGCSHTQRIS